MGEEASLLEPLLPMVIAFLHKWATSPVVQQEVVTEPMEADNVSAIPRCARECAIPSTAALVHVLRHPFPSPLCIAHSPAEEPRAKIR